jgi:hypothetical protein
LPGSSQERSEWAVRDHSTVRNVTYELLKSLGRAATPPEVYTAISRVRPPHRIRCDEAWNESFLRLVQEVQDLASKQIGHGVDGNVRLLW